MPEADATIRGEKSAILQTVATGELADGVEIQGDADSAAAFLSLFDVIAPNEVNLLLPPGVPIK